MRSAITHGITRLAMAVTVSATLIVPLAASPAAADDDGNYSSQPKGLTCRMTPSRQVQWAPTRKMIAFEGHNAKRMRMKVRAESTGAGLNIQRNWQSSSWVTLVQGQLGHKKVWAWTDPVRPDADWQLHIKMVWDRWPPQKDYVVHLRSELSTSCYSVT